MQAQYNKSLHGNATIWSVELPRLSASGELGRYAASPLWEHNRKLICSCSKIGQYDRPRRSLGYSDRRNPTPTASSSPYLSALVCIPAFHRHVRERIYPEDWGADRQVMVDSGIGRD